MWMVYTGGMARSIPISELRKRFGEIEKELPYVDHFVLTKKGKPIATLSSAPEVKKGLRQRTAGAWRDTPLDDDRLWKEVGKKKSRRGAVTL